MEFHENLLNLGEVLDKEILSPFLFNLDEYLDRYIHFVENFPKSGIGIKVSKLAISFLI